MVTKIFIEGKKKFNDENLPKKKYHEDDGTNGKDYEISGFGWDDDKRGYITVSEKSGKENDVFEEVHFPVPIKLNEEWYNKLKKYNN